jgi:hypothetical protein
MPIKIKTDLKTLKKLTDDVRKKFTQELETGEVGKELITAILDLINKGISPVDGAKRFQRYSKSYRDAIKKKYIKEKEKVSPVTMKKTGEMQESLKFVIKRGSTLLQFDDKKAAYHNDGSKKTNLPMRKLLPNKKGEKFTPRILGKIVKALKKATRKTKK